MCIAIYYYMSVDGALDTLVQLAVIVQIDVNGSVDPDTSFNSTAGWGTGAVTLFGQGAWFTTSYWNIPCPVGSPCEQDAGSSLVVREVFEFVTNSEYQISLLADVFARANISRFGGPLNSVSEVQISVDPVFEFVNPEDAALYTINFSPNIVPEPGTGLMLMSGLTALAAHRRSRFAGHLRRRPHE
jgi:hypothetical protein